MNNLEIPYEKDRSHRYRAFEVLPGAITWTMLFLPLLLSLINATVAAFFIIAYLLIVFSRAVGVSLRALQGHGIVKRYTKLDWLKLLDEIEASEADKTAVHPKWHYENIARLKHRPLVVRPSELIHVAMIAVYNESREVLEPTIQSVLSSAYDLKKVILVVAYEERGGSATETMVKDLVKTYKGSFRHAMAVKHPADIPGEIIGKGGNITYAGRMLTPYLEKEKLDPLKVVVTTLDVDNRPHSYYFAALSYVYALSPDPRRTSYQPISVYSNNIWDVPAPMRVIATGNSYWNMALTTRPHLLRNFSAHAQSMQSLLDTDFWSVRTIVEDGHQFWRSYFRYEGKYQVFPIYVPIYQDAVLAETYLKTLKAQFIQLRRWTWGASDVAYVADKGFFSKNRVPRVDLWFKFLRLLESHVSWATAPILLAFAAYVPVLFNSENYAANELPIVVSRIQTIALLGVVASIYICFKILPPKPARYKRHRTLFMLLQWVYMPLASLIFGASAALYSQTRLMFKKYIDKFDVTVKAVVSEEGGKITRRS